MPVQVTLWSSVCENSEYRGAYHAAEIMYAFDNVHDTSRTPYGSADQALADQVAGYWVNFAATGDPNGEGLPTWPAYEPSDDHQLRFVALWTKTSPSEANAPSQSPRSSAAPSASNSHES